MKILIIITRGDELGGAQTHVKDLISFMSTMYDTEFVLVAGTPGILTEEILRMGIPVHIITSIRREIGLMDLKAIFDLRKIIKITQPDIISCHSSKAGVIGRLAAIMLNVKKVFTAHGWAFTDGVSKKKAILYKSIEKRLANISDAIINVSHYDKRLAQSAGVKGKHFVIHNCVPSLKNEKIKVVNFSNIKLVMVARFCEQKDHDTLLKALAAITTNNWTLSLVGNGDSSRIEKLATDLGIRERINFMGQQNNVENILSDHDVFVLSTNWEGFPISTLEAMRASMPVIVTNVGGCNEAIEEGVNGFLVGKKDIYDLKEKLEFFLKNPSQIEIYGKKSKIKFEANFRIENMVQEYKKIFDKVIK